MRRSPDSSGLKGTWRNLVSSKEEHLLLKLRSLFGIREVNLASLFWGTGIWLHLVKGPVTCSEATSLPFFNPARAILWIQLGQQNTLSAGTCVWGKHTHQEFYHCSRGLTVQLESSGLVFCFPISWQR